MKAVGKGKKVGKGAAAATVAGGVLLLGALAFPYTGWARDSRFGKQGLDALIAEPKSRASDPVFLYWLGRRLNEAGRLSEAAPLLERAAALDGDSSRIRDEWVRAQLGTGAISAAYGQLRQFAGTHPSDPRAHLLLGRYYVTQNAYKTGSDALEKAVALDPKLAEAWRLLAHCRINLGGNGAGEDALRKALALEPGNGVTHLQLATLLAATRPDEARARYDEAVRLDPENAVAHRERGRFLLERGEKDAALADAKEAARRAPDDPISLLLLGRCLPDPIEARKTLERSADLAPFDPAAAQELRRLCLQAGDAAGARLWEARYAERRAFSEEKRQIDDLMAVHPEDRKLHQRLAPLLGRMGDVNGCIRQAAQGLGANLDDPKTLIAAAKLLSRGGQATRALPVIRKALMKAASNPDAIEALGEVYVGMGRLHEAAVRYESIRDWKAGRNEVWARQIQERAAQLAVDPSPVETLFRQAQNAPDSTRALLLLEKVLTLDPEHTRALRLQMQLRFGHGDAAGAQSVAERLRAISPEDGTAAALLAVLRLQQDDPLADADQSRLDALLSAAENDATAFATAAYARGLLALKLGRAPDAVTALKRAAQLDPTALAVWKKLVEAERLAGNPAGAAKAEAQYAQRTQTKGKS